MPVDLGSYRLEGPGNSLHGNSKPSVTFWYMMVPPATNDLCAITTSIISLMNAVNGLCTEIHLLIYPSILSPDYLQAIYMHLLHIYSNTNGKAYTGNMADEIRLRMQQHVD